MRTHRYRITISGRLGAIGREVFAGFDIRPDGQAVYHDLNVMDLVFVELDVLACLINFAVDTHAGKA